MKLFEFTYKFPNETACVQYLRAKREAVGISCKCCNSKTKHYWFEKQKLWKCSACGSRTNLKAGTIMHKSKMPLMVWFYVMHLMTSLKKPFSSLELQRQMFYKRYEPVWYIAQKVRIAMGIANAKVQLNGEVEMDEAFYEIVMEKESKINQPKKGKGQLKRGKGSERQAKVIVMAESWHNPQNKNKYRPSKSIGKIKMIVVDDLKSAGINYETKKAVAPTAIVTTDGLPGFRRLDQVIQTHDMVVVAKKDSSKIFPWVNIMISNSKREFLGTHHSIGKGYLQNYLNEFCYKFNHKRSQINLFDHVAEDCILA